MNAVIYARYSSHSQNEMSIEGQLAECLRYAKEQIADDSSGVITEGILEIFADYFSKQNAEKVTRGIRQNAEKCKYNGGNMTYDYAIDSDGYYILDNERAPIVKEIFERVAEGETVKSIMDDLNNRGVKSANGKTFPT